MIGNFINAASALFRAPKRLALAVVVGGIAARIYLFLLNRSFWIDEAKLALNVVRRSFAGLLGPLDFDQAAPIGFLTASKGMIGLLGNSDMVLRVIPLVAGCAAVFLMYRLSFALLAPSRALLAVLLFTLGRFTLYFSTDFKQYSLDQAIALALSVLTIDLVRKGPSGKRILLLGVSGVIALLCSFPAIFVLGGVGVTLLLCLWRANERRALAMIAPFFVAWVGTFAALALLLLHRVSANGMLQSYWADAFMPIPPWGDPLWVPRHLAALFVNPAGLLDGGAATAVLYCVLCSVGVIALGRRERHTGWLLFFPLVLALAGSALHRFPFSDRLMLWAVPALIIAVVEGAGWLLDRLDRVALVQRYARVAVAGILLFGPLRYAAGDVLRPKARQNIKPLLAYLHTTRIQGDLLYVYHKSRTPFLYYYPFYDLSPSEFLVGGNFPGNPESYLAEISSLQDVRRLWLLFSYVSPAGREERDRILRGMERMGRKVEEKVEQSASLHLYELNATVAGRF